LGHYIELDQHLLDEKHTHTHTHTQSSCHPWLILFTTFPFRMNLCACWSMLFFFPTYLTYSLLVLRGEKIVKPIGVKFSHMGFNNFHVWGKNCLNRLTKFTSICEYFGNSLVWQRCNKHTIYYQEKSWYFHTFHKAWSISEKVKHTLKITYIGPSEPAPIGAFYSLCL
jgi:hypothetical protein